MAVQKINPTACKCAQDNKCTTVHVGNHMLLLTNQIYANMFT